MSVSQGTALITGSAQGIGRSIALYLAKDGFNIALNDLPCKRDQLRAVADEVEKIGRKTHIVTADVTIEGEVQGMVQEVVNEFGGLDVMVANAGIVHMAPLVSTELDAWEHVMAINARGPFLCYKYAAQQMIKQGRGGRIIGASSVAGMQGLPLGSPYSASKWAVRGLTQTAALELGRYGITVNAYAPGVIQTPLTEEWSGGAVNADQEMIGWIMNYISGRPVKSSGQPEDVAYLVSYLASKNAHFITGQCLSVDGGMTMS